MPAPLPPEVLASLARCCPVFPASLGGVTLADFFMDDFALGGVSSLELLVLVISCLVVVSFFFFFLSCLVLVSFFFFLASWRMRRQIDGFINILSSLSVSLLKEISSLSSSLVPSPER